MDSKARDSSGPSRGRNLKLALLALSLVLLLAAGGWALREGISNSQEANRQAQPAPKLTAQVIRQTLQETYLGTAQIRPGNSLPLEPLLSSPAIITREPAPAGSRLVSGDVLTSINERPLFIFSGDLPAYRDLGPESRGKDVAQIQQTLLGLGYPIRDELGYYGQSTAYALYRFYLNSGYSPPGGTDQSEDPQAPFTTGLPLSEYVTFKAENFYLESSCGSLGRTATSPLCTISDGSYRLYLEADSSQQASRLQEGQPLILESAGQAPLEGVLAAPLAGQEALAALGDDQSQGAPALLYPLTLPDQAPLNPQASYRARVVIGSSAEAALTVPEAALIHQEGQTWVEEVETQQRLSVTVGYCQQGYCELLDPSEALFEGQQLTLASTNGGS